jgi:hypothetical protein
MDTETENEGRIAERAFQIWMRKGSRMATQVGVREPPPVVRSSVSGKRVRGSLPRRFADETDYATLDDQPVLT